MEAFGHGLSAHKQPRNSAFASQLKAMWARIALDALLSACDSPSLDVELQQQHDNTKHNNTTTLSVSVCLCVFVCMNLCVCVSAHLCVCVSVSLCDVWLGNSV